MTQTVEVPAEKPRSKLLAAAQHANTNPDSTVRKSA